jgi:hypothetical protein
MNFYGFDVNIIDITPGRKGSKDIHFSVDGYPTEHPYYEYIYDEVKPEDSWFSDNPDEFGDYADNSDDPDIFSKMTADFNKLVRDYIYKRPLTPKTLQTFNDLIDEL